MADASWGSIAPSLAFSAGFLVGIIGDFPTLGRPAALHYDFGPNEECGLSKATIFLMAMQ